MEISRDVLLDMYTRMVKIRKFEEKVAELFAQGKVLGFVHLYIGEEATAVGVCENLEDKDYITSTHRGHGHLIAKGGDLKYMMAELYGKETGYCKGKGGSMHIADATKGILGANGIVGGGFPIAAGAALSAKMRGTDQVAVCFFGDGASNQSTFHEALNIASIWKLPVVFVCENNLYGISMRQDKHQAIKDVADRAIGYGIPGVTVDGNDVLAVYEVAKEAINRARSGAGPTLVECKTYRYRGHFEGDPTIYRSKEEVEEWLAKDPILRLSKHILDNDVATEKELKDIEARIVEEVEEAVRFAEESPYPKEEAAVEDVYTDIVEEVRVR
ncbi:pyruvate dehydrogenase E1 component alpha subunit [Thermoanaerobacter thermohydrosulfuricus]|jgi:pyruvate dehydrogenase E1 component alpha subunit|uniref:Pyruvate dehydrogenase E1 component subunit alpha n=6 Tax=Thermoanaerobacter TaxID=1754 RepID=B0K8D4_THEP3|nr:MULTISPECIES: pyruvate dehydrogenase (acetyl-transferring) E1 component subunit alpha [Thermoanaerobacter]KUJ91035.1 MAG: pyruvate dehydrogenase (acetyl-transferring) E1 component subunit alpha [Thermoanaerobacter thermocopriae]ABY94447.1 Pyruvate dehydrogenase (acetyl-transferring) [Thermoanaerobacter pseudethanolicus ATCC 33223]ADV79400.1 pyruvate dehydrogenase (acetyl-transferring) E1 component, alpha subunit [Thermoanaerobacter brockii subsp. finnii Ako-1]AEM79033.1 pyruvate dehydrogenas